MDDLWAGQRLWKGGKNAVLQDINIPVLSACVGHALTTRVGSLTIHEFITILLVCE